jgi:hypothetical protein
LVDGHKANGPKASLVDANFLRGGRGFRLVSVHADNVLRVWIAPRKSIPFRAFDTEVKGFGFSPDGQFAVVVFKADSIVYRVRG